MRIIRRSACIVSCIALSLVVAPPADAVMDETTLVSIAGAFGPGGDSSSAEAAISADGRFVAFRSASNNLAGNDNDAVTNVYVRDLTLNTTTLASLPTGVDGTTNNANASDPAISADGRFVAFESDSDSLAGNDNDAVTNVYVRDLAANTTTLVGIPTGIDGTTNNNTSTDPTISADGRIVAFQSDSDNMATNDNDSANVYVRDLSTNITTLASLPTGTDGTTNNGSAFGAAISADGLVVAFSSASDNLAGNDNDAVLSDVYVRDLTTNITTLASLPTGTDGTTNTDLSYDVALSADGHAVSFRSDSDNMATNDENFVTNVYVRDLTTNTTALVSLPTGTDGTNNSDGSNDHDISADGRSVSFESSSDNLATNDTDAVTNVYIRDLAANTTTLASLPTGTDGTGNNNSSIDPAMSADGRFVAFHSNSDNMATNDVDAFSNIYRRDVLGPQPPPALEIGDLSGKEGKVGTVTFTFTATLDGTPGRTVTVDFATKNGTATLGDNDYEFSNGTLTFLPGETSKTIDVTVNGDKKRERSETFRVKLFNATAEIDDPTAIGTIRNDDR